MISVEDLAHRLRLQQLTSLELSGRTVRAGLVGDLLSWVAAYGRKGAAWVTVQTHVSVVAIAHLRALSCVIVAGGIAVPDGTITRADSIGMPVLRSEDSAYSLCLGLCALGVPA